MAVTSKYSVEVRNKAGNLIRYLTPWVQSLTWEWRRIGGCGNCSIKLALPYRHIDFNVLDDIQIRVVGNDYVFNEDGEQVFNDDGSPVLADTATKLVYRGFVSSVNPSLSKTQEISITVKGYSELLKSIIIQDTGVEKEYASVHVHAIVSDILTNFVIGNFDITAGTVYEDSFTVDAIAFKTSAASAFDTLAQLLGDIEYGVDENLEFYWKQESDTTRHKFFVGVDIEKLNRTKDYSDLVNKVYFEGAKDDDTGAIFKKTATASGSISAYYLAESILTNSSISTDTVADAYLTNILQQKSSPKYKLSFDIPNTSLRLEDVIPLGKVAIYDDDYDRGPATRIVWGTTANGGSNNLWGTVANSGDGALWGGGAGSFQQQVEYIQYELSDTDGRFNIKIMTGGSMDKFASKVKQLELLTADLRQRG